ncbi:MAG: hypothetical protein ACPGWM_07405, partial [Flavobacteriales bacterium]
IVNTMLLRKKAETASLFFSKIVQIANDLALISTFYRHTPSFFNRKLTKKLFLFKTPPEKPTFLGILVGKFLQRFQNEESRSFLNDFQTYGLLTCIN